LVGAWTTHQIRAAALRSRADAGRQDIIPERREYHVDCGLLTPRREFPRPFVSMRIISGRFRRRTLLTNPGLTTRPITDRVKESLFARLEPLLEGARVADIFAGTGTLGLEALSRGAARVTFIEKDRPAVELLRQNVGKLKVEAETLIWPADVFRCSFRPQNAEGFTPFDVIFFDPPYRLVPEIAAGSPLCRALQRLADDRVSAPDALLLLRVPEHAEFELPSCWRLDWTLTMSNMELLHLRKPTDSAPPSPPPASDAPAPDAPPSRDLPASDRTAGDLAVSDLPAADHLNGSPEPGSR